ncbi:PKD domain protein, partial [Candidatus Thiomargarita nelsonii]
SNKGGAPLKVALNASAFSGNITDYTWSSSDGQTATGRNTSMTFDTHGTYTISLTVTDEAGKTGTVNQTIEVFQAPIAAFTVTPFSGKSPLSGKLPLKVTLDASESSDPVSGKITHYAWSSSDGQTAEGQTTSLTFKTEGSYVITLTVTAEGERTATAQQEITVNPAQSN